MKKGYLKALSLLLTMSMILSLAVMSVSAIPAEYEVLATETHGFESGNDGIAIEGVTTIARSTAQAHTGSYSMAITCNNTTNARVYFNPTTKFTAGSKYYLSYWFYSDSWTGSTAYTNAGTGLTLGSWGNSSSTKGQWNKTWTTITCKADQTWIQLGFGGMTSGNVVYIDDLEVVKVTDTALKNNEIPAGAEASAIGYINGETTESNFNPFNTTNEALTRSAEFAHWGNYSWKLSNKTGAALSAGNHGLYLSVRDQLLKLGSSGTLTAGTPYYISYYVYSPNVSVKTKVVDHQTYKAVVPETAIPQATWTKVSQIFRLSESDGRFLLKLFIENAGTNDVYIDDIVLAELSTEPAFTLTQSDIDFYDNGYAIVTLTSSVELKGVDKDAITGATVSSATLSADAKTVTVELTGLEASSNYTLSFADLKDAYGRTKTVEATVTTPSASEAYMSISSSSIADGETGVLAPVSRLYIAAPYDLDEDTVVLANFTLTGGATITDVSLRNTKTICVEIDGTLPDTAYELAIDNVANTSGGILKDTLSWTTGAAEKSGKAGFEINTDGISYTGSNLSIVGASTEQAKSGSKSLKINATGNTNSALYWNAWNAGYQMTATRKDFELGKEYLVSFWIYADKNIQVRLAKHNGSNVFGLTSVTAGNWVKLSGKFAPTASAHIGNDLFQFDIRVTGTTNYYIDDLEIKTLSNISNPSVFKGDVPVSRIGEGDHTVEYTLKSAADKSVWSVVAQYDGNNMLKTFAHDTRTVTAGANTVVTVTVAGAKNLKTKLLIMDPISYAPQCDARIIKNN